MNKAVFLDRDGIINNAIWRDNKATGPRQLNEWQWTPHIDQSVTRLKQADFLVFVITNQPDVHRKLISQQLVNTFHQMIHAKLAIDDLIACMHDDVHHCHCRKPQPGMLLQLADKWQVSLSESFIIGDTERDMKAGKAAGCYCILIDKHYNQGVRCDYLAHDLAEATTIIIGK